MSKKKYKPKKEKNDQTRIILEDSATNDCAMVFNALVYLKVLYIFVF